DQLDPDLRLRQPDLRGDHRPDDAHQAGAEPQQRAVRNHPEREWRELAGQRHRAGVGREFVSLRFGFSAGRLAVLVAIGVAALLVTAVAVIPMAMVGGASMLFAAGVGCPSSGTGATTQPMVTTAARNSIPANYLSLFKKVGQQYGVPWGLLAGIGEVESDDGRSNLPGVHSGSNAFGAAGPMQIGIGAASSNTWGGSPVHPASQVVSGVATDEDGDGVASVYDPADAIAGAAKYLLAHGVQNNVSGAIFAY